MQATCVQRECPKCILSNDESILQNLPAELLVEVFQHLGWEDVFVMRRTCKLFFDISNSWPLWVCLFYRLSSEVRVAPILERPISAYTAKELEYVVMHRISSEIRWATGAPPRVRTNVLPKLDLDSEADWEETEDDRVVLLEGGRWLLTSTGSHCWRIFAHDLDMPPSQEPRCIISLNRAEQGWRLISDLDQDATSGLAWNLCLIPWSTVRPEDSPSDWAPDQIHIYRLTMKGRGNEAILEANKLKSLHNDLPGFTETVDFRGHYLVRSIFNMDSCCYHHEVCNWLHSDSFAQFNVRLQHDPNDSGEPNNIEIISEDKVAIISDFDISLYIISDLHPIPASKTIAMRIIEPYWKLTDPELSDKLRYSIPFPDLHATRMTMIMDGVIYGLTIPHERDNTPSLQRVSDADVSDMPLIEIGRNKIYAHDSNKGTIRTVHFLWPSDEDANRDVSLLLPALAQPSQHVLSLPYEWDDDEPLFDVYSNRVLSLVNESWVVVDFGYK